MALPKYDKSKRRRNIEQLPKGAYVIKIKAAREDDNKNGAGTHLTIAFDIAEGDFAGFYENQFNSNPNEDKKWPNDATFYLSVPSDTSPAYVWDNWNTFFADLEDSNNGFVFSGDPTSLKNKLIGGKFANEQSTWNGSVYDHIKLRWTCVADDVRNGKPGKMPIDKLVTSAKPRASAATDGFVNIPPGEEEELPF